MNWTTAGLLLVFLVHLVVFAILGLRRRQGYYLALVVTFSLLSAAMAFRLWWPELSVGDWPVSQLLRAMAWNAAVVSITWGLARFVSRRRALREP